MNQKSKILSPHTFPPSPTRSSKLKERSQDGQINPVSMRGIFDSRIADLIVLCHSAKSNEEGMHMKSLRKEFFLTAVAKGKTIVILEIVKI